MGGRETESPQTGGWTNALGRRLSERGYADGPEGCHEAPGGEERGPFLSMRPGDG